MKRMSWPVWTHHGSACGGGTGVTLYGLTFASCACMISESGKEPTRCGGATMRAKRVLTLGRLGRQTLSFAGVVGKDMDIVRTPSKRV